MAFRFKCASCDSEIVTQYLKVGEQALCIECNKYNIIPNNATAIPSSLQSRTKELDKIRKKLKNHIGDTKKTKKSDFVNRTKSVKIIKKLKCESCGQEQKRESALFCYKCGTDLYPKEMANVMQCPKCNETFGLSFTFCDEDGSKLYLTVKQVDNRPKELQDKEAAIKRVNKTDTNRTSENQVESNDILPMNWYKFVLWIMIPLGWILLLGSLLLIGDIMGSTFVILNLFGMFFSVMVFYSLLNKTTNSWKYLLLLKFISIVNRGWAKSDTYDSAGVILGTLIVLAIFLIPNYKYFNRRKHLFVN